MPGLFRQSAALALAALFAGSLVANAIGWHGCPHHGRAGGGGPAAGTAPATAPSPAGAVLDLSGGDHDRDPAAGTCTCVGSCHGTSAIPLAATTDVAVEPDGALRLLGVPSPTDRPARERPAYFLPFPHGPPALG